VARNAEGSSLQEIERNRQAAEDALQQLNWAIGYLEGVGKREVAKMGAPEEPLPSQKDKS
jgi:hypothetical protein